MTEILLRSSCCSVSNFTINLSIKYIQQFLLFSQLECSQAKLFHIQGMLLLAYKDQSVLSLYSEGHGCTQLCCEQSTSTTAFSLSVSSLTRLWCWTCEAQSVCAMTETTVLSSSPVLLSQSQRGCFGDKEVFKFHLVRAEMCWYTAVMCLEVYINDTSSFWTHSYWSLRDCSLVVPIHHEVLPVTRHQVSSLAQVQRARHKGRSGAGMLPFSVWDPLAWRTFGTSLEVVWCFLLSQLPSVHKLIVVLRYALGSGLCWNWCCSAGSPVSRDQVPLWASWNLVLVIQDRNNRGEEHLAFWPQLVFLSTCLLFARSVTCCLKELQLDLSPDTLALNSPAERGTCLFFFPFYYK